MDLPATLPNGLPVHAYTNIPIYQQVIQDYWPTFQPKSSLGAQVEQESCISLKHSKCWNEKAELKTSREYGFGLGQTTITSRFNMFDELKKKDKGLANWTWNDRFNAKYQLRAILVLNKQNYNSLKFIPSDTERVKMMYSAYNGGLGGVLKDRKICAGISSCNQNVWTNNVEKYSFKSKIKAKGYGMSFFEINRDYVRQVMDKDKRRKRYIFMDKY